MKMIRKRIAKTNIERATELLRDMVDEGLHVAYKHVMNMPMPNTTDGAVIQHITEAMLKMEESEQKKMVSKFKEILRG